MTELVSGGLAIQHVDKHPLVCDAAERLKTLQSRVDGYRQRNAELLKLGATQAALDAAREKALFDDDDPSCQRVTEISGLLSEFRDNAGFISVGESAIERMERDLASSVVNRAREAVIASVRPYRQEIEQRLRDAIREMVCCFDDDRNLQWRLQNAGAASHGFVSFERMGFGSDNLHDRLTSLANELDR
ncbi:hypothetical protein [Schlesneria paludicola]|uniref:hypothetical protein n=1 Tax=Schlesneria paludicola TaxID=360056 RepID=UPI0012FA6A52|nr:hypothetical protein [Schlesneria paludicola]